MLLVGRHDLERVTPDPERAGPKLHVVAFIVRLDQLAQDGRAPVDPADLEVDDHAAVGFRTADAVDRRHGGDHQHVSPRKDRGRGRQPHALDLLVDLGLLLDVQVVLGDVGLGLVVVVVGDEVFDGAIREEVLELRVELSRQSLVVGHYQRRALQPGDDVGDGERLARPGGAQQHLVLGAALEAGDELLDGFGLVARRPVGGMQSELGHRPLLSNRWARIVPRSGPPDPAGPTGSLTP